MKKLERPTGAPSFLVTSADDLPSGLHQHPELPEFDLSTVKLHRADGHIVVIHEDQITARCSLWWNDSPKAGGKTFGRIGHYRCLDDETARCLLESATERLRIAGCTDAIGPMDQNTWRDYRCVIDDHGKERFFLEPWSQPSQPQQFRDNGFTPVATYCSSFVEDLTFKPDSVALSQTRMNRLGVSIRSIRSQHVQQELAEIHSIAQRAFALNPFYIPMDRDDFARLYVPLLGSIREEFVLIAEHERRVVGFCFAIPDLLQQQRGETIDTIIVKTFAIAPGRRYSGLGQVLMDEVHTRAAAAGFRFGIHALVREAPHLQRIIGRYGDVFRRYALFGKEIRR